MKKLSEVLTGPETWCQRVGRRVALNDGRVMAWCLSSAFRLVSPDDDGLPLLQEVIVELFPARSGSVVGFNDHRDTTWGDVASVVEEYDRRMLLRMAPADGPPGGAV